MIHPFCTGNERDGFQSENALSFKVLINHFLGAYGLQLSFFSELIIVVNDLMMLENKFFFSDLRNNLELDGMFYVLVKIYCL